MKTRIITFLMAAFAVSIAQAAPETAVLEHTLAVTPEIKKAFHADDSIKIKSVTGTAPKFQVGGTYRIVAPATSEPSRTRRSISATPPKRVPTQS